MTQEIDLLRNGPDDAATTLILAHGAGAPMDTPFMDTIAKGVAEAGIAVIRFEFPYMMRRREDGKRRPPDRQPALLETWRAVFSSATSARIAIGGKSMGGRMASLIADEVGATSLVCLGYPFHPPGKPDRLRTEHLATMQTPTLILQGERDPFGTKAEVDGYDLADTIEVQWLGDGNHDLAPRKKSGRTHSQNLEEAVAGIIHCLSK
ncbi:MAG: dienelactone hydrolase family protein [Alphaproteobacteria bacterium]|jgi:predicted alpha/beta-hydrolase family hydrolase|nr:dienelactone hydrolase family protein [Alphaproteobacteria bacterium]